MRDIRKERIRYLADARRFVSSPSSAAKLIKGRVLDAGCGNGAFLRVLKSKDPRIKAVGVDRDSTAISEAARKERRCKQGIGYITCPIQNMPFENR